MNFTEEEMDRGDYLHDEARDRAYEKEIEERRAMIPTPRTDDQESVSQKPIPWSDGRGQTILQGYVPSNFARALEREISNMTDQRDAAIATIKRLTENPEKMIPEVGKKYRLRSGEIVECVEKGPNWIRCEHECGPFYYYSDGTPCCGTWPEWDCIAEMVEKAEKGEA